MKKNILRILPLILFGAIIITFSNCKTPDINKGIIPWNRISNPIYDHADWSVKDACMEYRNGNTYIFFSAFFYDSGRERSHVVCIRTKDFKTFSEPIFIWSGIEDGWIGMCSPNITFTDGKYYMSYNSWGDISERPNQLFYAVSSDLEKWESVQKPLAQSLTLGKRSIDASLAKYDNKWYLVWKEEQTPRIAFADSINSDNWEILGTPAEGRWFENSQFLIIDQKVNMLVTASAHQPNICTILGDPLIPLNWLNWSEFKRFDIKTQNWNTDNNANSAFLVDWRNTDGYFYLLYAGRTEKLSHRGRGDNKLGLSRSKDMLNWESLPEKK
jgi:hypothetical protein